MEKEKFLKKLNQNVNNLIVKRFETAWMFPDIKKVKSLLKEYINNEKYYIEVQYLEEPVGFSLDLIKIDVYEKNLSH